MTQPVTSRIGPYTITREIGRGGMGVVYLARDDRLDREVAIKCLPDELADDPDRLARFQREAKTLASLNHPNIASIYGLEEVDGKRYLILEYVPGETLDEVLSRGPMPVSEALPVAKQIAEAIEAAHEKGIIHRDLKPANIKFAEGDLVKVLDFGLAKAFEERATTASEFAASPTYIPSNTPTMPGVVLGTAGYLSPEQARGRSVDKRTDIFSFGCVLYEMLAGKTIFPGETVTDSLGATLHKDPNWDDLPPDTPPTIRLLLRRCLTKDRKRRLHDIADARVEIEDAISDPTSSSLNLAASALAAAGAKSRHQIWPKVVAALVFGAAATGVTMWALRPTPKPPPPPSPAHLTMALGADLQVSNPVLSNDGRRLVMIGHLDSSFFDTQVLVRDLDDPAVRAIPGAEGIYAAGLSPDGEWIFFRQEGKLKKIPVDGGPAVTICDADTRNFGDGIWTDDGTLIVAMGRRGLHRVNATGGELTPMYGAGEVSEVTDIDPVKLPNGGGVLFTRFDDRTPDWETVSIMALPADGGEPRELVHGAVNARYLHTGHLIYQREDTLMAVGFDLDRLEVTTNERPVLQGIGYGEYPGGITSFDISRDGTLVYLSEVVNRWRRTGSDDAIGLLTLDGEWTQLIDHTGHIHGVSPSPDDRLLAIEMEYEPTDGESRFRVYTYERERDLLRPVVDSTESEQENPTWHPNGRWLVFTRNIEDGPTELCRYRVGSQDEPTVLFSSEDAIIPRDFSNDGRVLMVLSPGPDQARDIALLQFDERGDLLSTEPEPLIEWPGAQSHASFSADDRWMLFSSRFDGGTEIFVASVDDPSRSEQISVNGGSRCTWAPDQDRIYYTNREKRENEFRLVMYAVDFTVSDDGQFLPSAPVELFDIEPVTDLHSIHMTADGTSFYLKKSLSGEGEEEEAAAPNPPQIVLNWPESIKHLLPKTE